MVQVKDYEGKCSLASSGIGLAQVLNFFWQCPVQAESTLSPKSSHSSSNSTQLKVSLCLSELDSEDLNLATSNISVLFNILTTYYILYIYFNQDFRSLTLLKFRSLMLPKLQVLMAAFVFYKVCQSEHFNFQQIHREMSHTYVTDRLTNSANIDIDKETIQIFLLIQDYPPVPLKFQNVQSWHMQDSKIGFSE